MESEIRFKVEREIIFKVGQLVLLRIPDGREFYDLVRKVDRWHVWLTKYNNKFSNVTGWSFCCDPEKHSRIFLLSPITPVPSDSQ